MARLVHSYDRSARILSSVRRLERTARRISKDIASALGSIDLCRSKICSHEGRIGRLHEEAQQIQNDIAARMATLKKLESVPEGTVIGENQETSSQSSGTTPSESELLLSNPLERRTLECMPGLATPSCATPSHLPNLNLDLPSMSDGFMDSQEWGSLEWLTTSSPTPSSRIQ